MGNLLWKMFFVIFSIMKGASMSKKCEKMRRGGKHNILLKITIFKNN